MALVIDDLVSTEPWSPRFLRIYGSAEVINGKHPHLRVTPTVSWSWNLGGRPLDSGASAAPPKRTVHR